MTRADQIVFVRDLSARIAAETVAHVRAGDFPPEWDGHELRAWLADEHAESAKMGQIRRDPRGRRAREYRQIRLITPYRAPRKGRD